MHPTSFYQGKKVLVTGGCSFIGSHLAESLVSDGAIVTIVDDFSSGRQENVAEIAEQINLIKGDLRDTYVAESVIKNQNIVFHLANIHGGRGFIETHPGEICQNFLIDGNVFRYSQMFNVDRVCFTSSACAYPTTLQTSDAASQARYLSEEMADPFRSGCALADGEYGWAKFMGEMALKAYNKQFGLKGVSCRLFTVYGPRENESHAIMAFIAKAICKQSPFEIWGSGQQDRNFTYVSDIVQGLKLATERITDCRSVNLGTNEITKIIDAARLACELVGHTPGNYFCDTTKPEGVFARSASVNNQQKWLNWSPSVSFREGLALTVDWYKTHRSIREAQNAIDSKLFER